MDGTLLDPSHRLSTITAACLQELSRSHIPYVVATGRHFKDVEPYLDQLPGLMAGVLCNGGCLWQASAPRIYTQSLDRKALKLLMGEAASLECSMFVSFNDGEVYAEVSKNQEIREFQNKARIYQFAREGLHARLGETSTHPYKVSFIGIHEHLREVSQTVQELSSSSTPPMKTAFGLRMLLDVQPSHVSKASALASLCSSMGISSNDVIAVGDGMNDEEMIRWAGFGYVMGNAPDAMKQIARFVLPSNADDGVAQMLQHGLSQWKK